MCLAVLIMPIMNAMAKSLTIDYPLTMVVWARFTGHFVTMTLVFWPSHGPQLFKSAKPSIQFARSAIMFLSNGCYIAALSIVALATASAIMFTAPLIVTALSPYFLGERVGIKRFAAVIIGFFGVLIIIRPGLDTPSFDASAFGITLLLISAASFAIYQILTRKISNQDSAETMIVYTALIPTIVMTCYIPFIIVLPNHLLDWLLFLSFGVLGGFTQYLIAKALEEAPASVVSPYLYGELLVAAIIGFAIFGELPDISTWVGALVIIGSGIFIAYREGVIGNSKASD